MAYEKIEKSEAEIVELKDLKPGDVVVEDVKFVDFEPRTGPYGDFTVAIFTDGKEQKSVKANTWLQNGIKDFKDRATPDSLYRVTFTGKKQSAKGSGNSYTVEMDNGL